MAVCAVRCGAEGWEGIEEDGYAQGAWCAEVFTLPHGLPRYQTFRRVLSQGEPEECTKCFMAWTSALRALSAAAFVALDGTTLRHAFARATSHTARHLVRAWATTTRLVRGQVNVDDQA